MRPLSIAVLCAMLGAAACGKKGAPLPPLVTLPAAVGDFSARRLGQDVMLRFAVPSANTTGARPADLARIEIYAYTGKLASAADVVAQGVLVGTVAVKPPPSAETGEAQPSTKTAPAGADQGATVVVRETLKPDAAMPAAVVQAPAAPVAAAPTAGAATAVVEPVRYYVAVGVNTRGRNGALSPVLAVPLSTAPPAPTAVSVTYDEKAIAIAWEPLAGPPPAVDSAPVVDATLPVASAPVVAAALPVVSDPSAVAPPPVVSDPLSVQDPDPDSEPPVEVTSEPVHVTPPPGSAATPSAPAFAYNIYEANEPGSTDATLPAPLSPMPVAAPPLALTPLEFGRTRCYVVRTVATAGATTIESEASEPVCVTPVDTFPPAAPRALAAVPTATTVSLIWEANTEEDLAGYLVLRGDAAGEKLTPLTPVAIRETTYRDTDVRPDVTYVYAVVAVDTATPPNVSEHSNQAAGTAR